MIINYIRACCLLYVSLALAPLPNACMQRMSPRTKKSIIEKVVYDLQKSVALNLEQRFALSHQLSTDDVRHIYNLFNACKATNNTTSILDKDFNKRLDLDKNASKRKRAIKIDKLANAKKQHIYLPIQRDHLIVQTMLERNI